MVVVLLPIDTIDDPGATLFPITGFNSDLYIPGDGIPLRTSLLYIPTVGAPKLKLLP